MWPLAAVTQQEDPKEQDWPPGHLTASDIQTGGRLASRGLWPHCYIVWVLGPPGVMGTRWQGQSSGHPEGGTKPPQLLSSPSRSSRSPKGSQEEVPTPEAWGHLGQVPASWDHKAGSLCPKPGPASQDPACPSVLCSRGAPQGPWAQTRAALSSSTTAQTLGQHALPL